MGKPLPGGQQRPLGPGVQDSYAKARGPLTERAENIVNTLFPTHPIRQDENVTVSDDEISFFVAEDLDTTAKGLQNRKAPGPDRIPVDALKVEARTHPQVLLRMYNACLRTGEFPRQWKTQRLVLISKGKGDINSPSAYRTLCMLNTTRKLIEMLLKPRLERAIQTKLTFFEHLKKVSDKAAIVTTAHRARLDDR